METTEAIYAFTSLGAVIMFIATSWALILGIWAGSSLQGKPIYILTYPYFGYEILNQALTRH